MLPSLLENFKVSPVSPLFSPEMNDYVDSESFLDQNQGDSVAGPLSKKPKSLRLKKRGKENDPINDVSRKPSLQLLKLSTSNWPRESLPKIMKSVLTGH